MYDLMIRNAFVIDGTGSLGFHSDVAIKAGKIAAMGARLAGEAETTIDATGLTLTPGFINAHSHGDAIVEEFPECLAEVEQGITTQVSGMCGESAAPLSKEHLEDGMRILASLKGNDLNISVEDRYTMGRFLKHIDHPLGNNMAFLVGHGTLRAAVMGFADRKPTDAEMEQMKAILKTAMEEGACGISYGLIYPPGSYCDTDEMVALCKVVAEQGGVMTVHMRSESARLIEATEEMLEVTRRSGVRCVISHHKATGGKENWGKTKQTLELIEKANAEGLDVFCDQYPYTASSTGLATNIPDKMHALGKDKLLAILSSRQGRDDLRPLILGKKDSKERFQYTMIGASPSHPEYNGRMLNEIAESKNQDPYELQCDILLDDKLLTSGIFHTMCEEDVERVMRSRRAMIGTDGLGYPGCSGAHPRTVGTFPRYLGRYIRERKCVTLEEGIRKITSMPAQVYGLAGKGVVMPNLDADLCLFDSEKIIDNAVYGDYNRRCDGLNYVLIAGKVVVENGKFNGTMAGRVIRKPR